MGGITNIQELSECAFDSMPSSALSEVDIDYSLSAADMGQLLHQLIEERNRMKPKNVSQAHQEMGLEVSIAIGDDAFEKGIMEMGPHRHLPARNATAC